MARMDQERIAAAMQVAAVVLPLASRYLTTHAALGQLRQARDWAVLLSLIGVAAAAISLMHGVRYIGWSLLTVNVVSLLLYAWLDTAPVTF